MTASNKIHTTSIPGVPTLDACQSARHALSVGIDMPRGNHSHRFVKHSARLMAGVLLAASLSACVSPNDIAMKVGAPPESAVKLRSMETRRYDTKDQTAILSAAMQTLQDLGFTLTESSTDVGVLVGSKQRDAEEGGQVAAQVALTVALALLGTYHQADWDKEQTIAVTLVTTPVENADQTDVRVSFDRQIRTMQGLTRAELIQEPDIYQEFFSKLSQGVFLEGHEI